MFKRSKAVGFDAEERHPLYVIAVRLILLTSPSSPYNLRLNLAAPKPVKKTPVKNELQTLEQVQEALYTSPYPSREKKNTIFPTIPDTQLPLALPRL